MNKTLVAGIRSTSHVVACDWIRAAAQLPGKSLQVAIALWFLSDSGQRQAVEIGNRDLVAFGVDRNSKYRALAWMEQAGLILVDRKPGQSPVVKIVLLEGGDE